MKVAAGERKLALSLDEKDVRALHSAIGVFELSANLTGRLLAPLIGVQAPRVGEGQGETSKRMRRLREMLEAWMLEARTGDK